MNFILSFCVHINRSTKFQTHRTDSKRNQYAWQNSHHTPCTKQSLTPRNNTFLNDPWQFKISAPWLRMSGTIHSLTHEIHSCCLVTEGNTFILTFTRVITPTELDVHANEMSKFSTKLIQNTNTKTQTLTIRYDIFVNCNWVVTRWQVVQYKHTNNT